MSCPGKTALRAYAALILLLTLGCSRLTLGGDGSSDPDTSDTATSDTADLHDTAELHDRDEAEDIIDEEETPPLPCPTGSWGDVLFEFEADDTIVSTPAIGSDGTIYFGTQNATLYAVDCHGNEKWIWKYPCDEGCPYAFEGSPAIAEDGTIYIGDDLALPSYFFAVSPEGGMVWEYETWTVYGNFDASPAIADDGTIYAGAHGFWGAGPVGQILAFDPGGNILDGFPLQDTGAIRGSPAIMDNILFVGESSNWNRVSSVTKQADILWRTELSSCDECYLDMSSIAITGDGLIVLVENFGEIADAMPHSLLVILDHPSMGPGIVVDDLPVSSDSIAVGSPVAGPGEIFDDIFIAMENGHLVKVSRYPGEITIAISFDIEIGNNCYATPVLADDGFIYAAADSRVLRITREGAFTEGVDTVELSGTVSSSLAMDGRGVLYMGTGGGKLIALATDAGGPDPEAAWPTFRHDQRNTGNAGTRLCGGMHGIECADDSYFCEFPDGTCPEDDLYGKCVRVPDVSECPDYDICPWVCGCDHETYCDDCERRSFRVSKDHDGECE